MLIVPVNWDARCDHPRLKLIRVLVLACTFVWREGVKYGIYALPCCFDRPFFGLSRWCFQLREVLLDRIGISAIGRQEQQPGADAADGLAVLAAQIAHDHDVTSRQARDKKLLDIGYESLAVDESIEHVQCINPVMAQGRKEGQRPWRTLSK